MDEDTDYYRILEIDDSADEATIKQVVKANYRRLAREHHPDKNPGDKNATARFQKIQHAFDILSDDERRKEYNEGRAGRRREAAARQAKEAEQQRNRQQQYDRQRRQQEYQRRQEEEQRREQQKRRDEEERRQREEQHRQQEEQRRRQEEQRRQQQKRREEETRRQREGQRQRDEQRRQDEKRRYDEQQRAWEQRQAREDAERKPDPDVRQPRRPKSGVPTPMSRLFGWIQSNGTRAHWWLLPFVIVWIAWSLLTPEASPPLTPLHEVVKELRISQSLGEVQTSFTDKYNLPYELQLMEPLVGALIDPVGRSSVDRYWDCSADAVDGAVEAFLVPNRLIAEVNRTIRAAILQLNGMNPRKRSFFYQVTRVHTAKRNRTLDKEARQVLGQMTNSICEALDKALTTLKITEHSLGMLLETLQVIVVSSYGKRVQDKFPGEDLGAVVVWEAIFNKLSPTLLEGSPTGSTSFYDDARQVREVITNAKATMKALQDRLLGFQTGLHDAPLSVVENTLELYAGALYVDWYRLKTIQAYESSRQKLIQRNRRIVKSLMHV